jgi:RimJ/RimL family protein N-acetyltransferase
VKSVPRVPNTHHRTRHVLGSGILAVVERSAPLEQSANVHQNLTPELRTARLVLTALQPSDAFEMVAVLSDIELYAFTGGEPPGLGQLQARYQAQVAGSPNPDEDWHNWIVRLAESHVAAGFVQATVTNRQADVAWLIGVGWQGHGFAREAALAMCVWLRLGEIARITAHIHPDHSSSARVAAAIGLQCTGDVDDSGEQVWVSVHK